MIIFHGDDGITSYQKLSELIENYKASGREVVYLDGPTLDPTHLRQLTSVGLFGSDKVLVIKNLLSNQKSKSKELLVDILSQVTDTEVILYESKKLSDTNLKQFPKAKVSSFAVSQVIFKFLDLLRPGNYRNILTGWNRLVTLKHEPEYVFAMIVRQIRLLIQAKSGPSYLKLAPYPKKMFLDQAVTYDLSHLLDLHEQLYQIDKKIKTGASPLPIDQLLIQFFLKI